MVKRQSNRARISRKAEEAAAAKTGKAAKKKKVTKKKTTRKKKAKAPPVRQKVVWKVFDGNYNEVACFAYPDKAKAYAKADELTKAKEKTYFVNAVKVDMEEE